MSDKTCGNCNCWTNIHRLGHCYGCEQKSHWQPIPVATTEAPRVIEGYPTRENMQHSADYYKDYGELKPRYVAWMLAMYDDLAKRDDLIRRMAEWINARAIAHCVLNKFPEAVDAQSLMAEANELMGVK